MAIKISSFEHSGHLRPHEHTSYSLLAALVLLVGVLLAGMTMSSFASANANGPLPLPPTPGPQADSVALAGTMPEPAPKTGAVITSPTTGQHFSTSPVNVSGTCPKNTLVEIYKNNIFAGSSPCTSNDTFTVKVDLLYGSNSLTAVDYDVLNQAGPSSAAVDVSYDAQPPTISSLTNVNFTATQLILETDAVYRGTFPGQELNVPITIMGGAGPFAVNIQWGDNTNKVIPASNNTTINATHVYQKPGTYKITIQGSDSQQHVAFLEIAAVINGQPATGIASTSKSPPANKFLMLWPLYACAATLVVSFWLGENREKHVLEHRFAPRPTLGPTPHTT